MDGLLDLRRRPAAGAILGWVIYAVVIKGDMNLKDDIEAIRKDVGGAIGGGDKPSTPEGGATA